MKLAFGLYTEMSLSTPESTYNRALSLVYKPVLTYLYNNPGNSLSLYQSVAMMKYLDSSFPEVNMLISSLAKRGDLELITGTYSQSILSLLPPKDRSLQIERMITQIRKYYGVRASAAFFYGQIWSPSSISSLRNSGIRSVVISTYRATSKEQCENGSFVMNELGKKMQIRSVNDSVSSLVSEFAQGHIGFREFSSSLMSQIERSEDGSVLFLNIDQLLEGAARDNADQGLSSLIQGIYGKYGSLFHKLDDIPISKPGYIDAGWYGRDAYASTLTSFNDIFVRNESFRYLLNRYIALCEFSSTLKKDKERKSKLEQNLFHIPTGPLFIHDAQCTPLRLEERRHFWKNIIEAESAFIGSDQALYREYDFEELGESDHVFRNSQYITVLSPKGGAVAELDYLPLAINCLDPRTPFDRSFPNQSMKKSFSCRFILDGKEHSTSESMFDTEAISPKKGEYLFTLSDPSLPFDIEKHFRMRSQTMIMDVLLIPREKETRISGEYIVDVFASLDQMMLSSSDQRKLMLLGCLDDTKTVRYTEPKTGLQLLLSSTSSFCVRESREKQSQYTSLGLEAFDLYTRLSFSFPLEIKEGEAAVYRLVVRMSDTNNKNRNKESEHVHRE